MHSCNMFKLRLYIYIYKTILKLNIILGEWNVGQLIWPYLIFEHESEFTGVMPHSLECLFIMARSIIDNLLCSLHLQVWKLSPGVSIPCLLLAHTSY